MTTFYRIKPANILMGNEEILKVTDFGLVRVGDATAEIAGKIEYFYREKA
jgi:serine/threonine protein kinase